MYQQAGVGDLVNMLASDFQAVDCFWSGADFDGADADYLTERRTQSFTRLQFFSSHSPHVGCTGCFFFMLKGREASNIPARHANICSREAEVVKATIDLRNLLQVPLWYLPQRRLLHDVLKRFRYTTAQSADVVVQVALEALLSERVHT